MASKAVTKEDVAGYQKTVFFTAKQSGLNDAQAKIIVAQAQHESGNFQSPVFVDDNNLFGMKMPSKRSKEFILKASNRVRTREGATPYASYATVADSVKDLILSYHKNQRTNWSLINTPAEYATYLKSKGYYGASLEEYTTAITKFFSRVQNLKYSFPFGLIFFFNSNLFINLKP